MAALEGLTLKEALEEERGRDSPSKFSTGVSNRAILGLRSSPFGMLKDALRLGGSQLLLDSSSLESLSNSPGYRSRTDFVGLVELEF